MKRNNYHGFTLVELLAVIVILGILLVIAVPSVLGTMNSSKRDAFIDFSLSIIKKSEETSLSKLAANDVSEMTCFKYTIEEDLANKNNEEYKGWIVYDGIDDVYYMTLYTEDYMLYNFVYVSDDLDSMDKLIKEGLTSYDETKINELKSKLKNDEGEEDITRVFTINAGGEGTPTTLEEKCKKAEEEEEEIIGGENVNKVNETRIYLLSGKDFNTAIKQTVKDYYSYTTKVADIQKINFTCDPTHHESAKVISTTQTKKKAYAWYSGDRSDTIYISYDDCDSDEYKMDVYLPSDMSYMFYEIPELSEINGFTADYFKNNPNGTTNLSYFISNTNIYKMDGKTTFNFNWIDTSKTTLMVGTFQSNPEINGLNISEWDTSNVTNFSNIFYGCQNLKSLDVSKFVGTKATKLNRMFFGCEGLTTIDLSSFAPQVVDNLTGMFEGCTGLTKIIGLTKFNVSNVTSFTSMFRNCRAIKYLVLTNWKLSNKGKLNMNSMFENCSSLRHVVVDHSWQDDLNNRDAYSEGIFNECDNLVAWDRKKKCKNGYNEWADHCIINKGEKWVFEAYDFSDHKLLDSARTSLASVNNLNTTEGTKCYGTGNKCALTDVDHFKEKVSDYYNYML